MRYFTESLVIAIVAFYIPKVTLNINELLMISLTGAFSLMILDLFAPQVGVALRYGMGGTLGYNNVNTPVTLFGGNDEGNDECNGDPWCESVTGMKKKFGIN
jgi:uncharacterized membrane protein YqaE (UPF0057 family)